MTHGPAMGAGMATAVGKALEKLMVGLDEEWLEIMFDVSVTAGLGKFANVEIQKMLPYDLAYGFRKAVSQETLDWLEAIVAGGVCESIYMEDYRSFCKCHNIIWMVFQVFDKKRATFKNV